MARRIYIGPIDSIETELDGVQMFLDRGDAVDVSDTQAAVLDLCPDNWAKPRSTVSDKTVKDGD